MLVTSTAWGETTLSSSANSVCLTSSRSTTASTTRSQSASSVSVLTVKTRFLWASAVALSSRFLATSLSHCTASSVLAFWLASGCTSNSLTMLPACAAICAMPRPMAPVPTIPTVLYKGFMEKYYYAAGSLLFSMAVPKSGLVTSTCCCEKEICCFVCSDAAGCRQQHRHVAWAAPWSRAYWPATGHFCPGGAGCTR